MDESAVAKEILNWLQVSKDFVSEQAPLLAQEMLRWGLVSYITLSILALVFLVVALVGMRKAWKAKEEIGFALSIPCAVGFLVMLTVNLMGATQILVAPRLYLIEQLSWLVR